MHSTTHSTVKFVFSFKPISSAMMKQEEGDIIWIHQAHTEPSSVTNFTDFTKLYSLACLSVYLPVFESAIIPSFGHQHPLKCTVSFKTKPGFWTLLNFIYDNAYGITLWQNLWEIPYDQKLPPFVQIYTQLLLLESKGRSTQEGGYESYSNKKIKPFSTSMTAFYPCLSCGLEKAVWEWRERAGQSS